MKYQSQTEVIFFTKNSFRDLSEKTTVFWLLTSGHSEIAKQEASAKKIFLSNLRDSPAIYLS